MRTAVYKLTQFAIRVFGRLFWRLSVEGAENLPAEGPVVIAVTHNSFLDPPLVGSVLRRPVKFVARQTLFTGANGKRKPLAPLIRFLGAVPIDRDGGGARAGLNTCLHWLERGWPVLIFPEGTRSPDGRLQRFRKGVGILALQARYPVLPVSLEGTGDVWPKGRKLPRFSGRVRVRVGKPTVYDKPMKPEAVAAQVRGRILDLRGATEPGRDGPGAQEIAGGRSSS